jgi:hypothetical protein
VLTGCGTEIGSSRRWVVYVGGLPLAVVVVTENEPLGCGEAGTARLQAAGVPRRP